MDDEELINQIDLLFQEYMKPLKNYLSTQKALKDFNISDQSAKPKTTNITTKFSLEYNGDTYTYTKNKKCKYCESHYTAWKQPYEQGDRPISVDYDGNVIEGGCPKYN